MNIHMNFLGWMGVGFIASFIFECGVRVGQAEARKTIDEFRDAIQSAKRLNDETRAIMADYKRRIAELQGNALLRNVTEDL